MPSWFELPIAETASSILSNKVVPSEIHTEAGGTSEEPPEPDRSTLIPSMPVYQVDGEAHQLSAESLIAIIELGVICLHESSPPPIEQMRAKRLLKGALNLYPEGFIIPTINRSTSNIGWETLLSIYIEINRLALEPHQIVPPRLQKNFNDWFNKLDNFHKDLLLDLLL